MAFDGVAVSCIVKELGEALTDGRIEKITQPERDEIHMTIRARGRNNRLIVSASSSNPRVHLTGDQKQNPDRAPMFCMLLRKHIASGKIIGFSQPEFERVVRMDVESYDEMGDLSVKSLMVEIMGRHSNIILIDVHGRVLGSVKHVDFTVSSMRQVIPGMLYELPPSQGKLNPLDVAAENIYPILCATEYPADKFVLETFVGIGPMNAREIAFRAVGDGSRLVQTLSDGEKRALANEIAVFFAAIKGGEYSPVLLYKEKRLWDFNAFDVKQYGGVVSSERIDNLLIGLDEFYGSRDRSERMSQKSAGLLKLIDNNISRCRKKLGLQQQKLTESAGREQYKIIGDLLISNLHVMSEKMTGIELENFFDDMKPIKINLLPELSPSGNVQRYYNLYQKAKNAEKMSKEQIALTEEELIYLESVKESVLRAESERDISEIRSELEQQGYRVRTKAQVKGQAKGKKEKPTEPLRFVVDGFEVFVGKNNLQNDRLTIKESRNSDLWFHVKSFPGSHTVVKTNGQTPSDDSIVKFAKLAAYHSKARESANVPVDYTVIKNVKKPSGSKPGMVIYDNYNTVNVRPEAIAAEE